jgi:hypothetical protein
MTTFYLVAAVAGGVFVVLQSVFGFFEDTDDGGHADDHDNGHGHVAMHDTLDILSLRTLSAGITAFGLSGGLMNSLGLRWFVSLPGAAVVGFGVMVAVALLLRQMGRFESDGSLVMEGVIGETGTVYLPIPADRAGLGKVTTVLQSQIVELEAQTEGPALAVGAKVLITDLNGSVANVIPLDPIQEGVV